MSPKNPAITLKKCLFHLFIQVKYCQVRKPIVTFLISWVGKLLRLLHNIALLYILVQYAPLSFSPPPLSFSFPPSLPPCLCLFLFLIPVLLFASQ